jgi:hypothetical protein
MLTDEMLAPTAERPHHFAYPEVLSGLGYSSNPAGSVMHAVSWSTGSVLADAMIGGRPRSGPGSGTPAIPALLAAPGLRNGLPCLGWPAK